MLFGINQEIESRAVPGMTAVWRDYASTHGLVETLPETGLTTFVAVSPPLHQVVSGEMDKELASWLQSLPPGTYATILDGANAPHLGIEAAMWREANSRLQSIKATVGARVQCGYVLDTYPLVKHGLPSEDWIIGHADWAGLIGHQESLADTPRSIFHDTLSAIAEAPGMPELAVVATGTSVPDGADAWAADVLGYALRWNTAPLDALLWFARIGHSKFGGVPSSPMIERMCREAAWAQ